MGKGRKIMVWILAAVAVLCAGVVVSYFWQEHQNQDVYKKIQEEIKEPEESKVAEASDPGVEIPIDFEALQEMNQDIYAWIQIEGTNINYPIVQNPDDDSYYLMRTVERQDGYPGSIYTERCNQKDFMDFNTLIYGHDMMDGSMFQNLHNYSDAAYMEEHPEVVIYTPEKMLTYQIFAAVVYDNRHIMNTFDFRFDSERQRFLDSVYSARDMSNVVREDIPVDVDSRIITMSTCVTGQDDKRLIVGAVLTDEKEKKSE